MVSFYRVNYPFRKSDISSLKFVLGIGGLALGNNTNPGYLDVETMLSTPLAVETTQESRTEMLLRRKTFSQISCDPHNAIP